MRRLLVLCGCIALLLPLVCSAQEPQHREYDTSKVSPLGEKIAGMTFPPLTWHIPRVGHEIIREKLKNGLVVYLYPERTVPSVSLSVVFRGGRIYETPEEDQLASLMGSFMKMGGTRSLTYEQLTEELDGMAASLSTYVGSETGSVDAHCLKEHMPRVMEIVHDVLLEPGFREDKLDLVKKQRKEAILRQKDYPSWITRTLFSAALYGDHPYGRIARFPRIEAITKADIEKEHARLIVPERAFIAVSGDFDPGKTMEMVKKLFGSWKAAKGAVLPPYQKVQEAYKPGFFYFEKDIPQTNLRLGHLGTKRGNPDEFSLVVMNAILGGESFKSRLDTRVRSDEGLAYSVGSWFGTDALEPSSFVCYAQTKNEKIHRTITIMRETISEMKKESPTAEEMKQAKETIINSFIHRWTDAAYALDQIMNLEVENRPRDYYETYIDNVRKVTADDVLRVAGKYLHPDKLVVVLVGKRSDMKDLPEDIRLKEVTLPPEYLK
jgi:zinc protease